MTCNSSVARNPPKRSCFTHLTLWSTRTARLLSPPTNLLATSKDWKSGCDRGWAGDWLRLGILQSKAEQANVHIPRKVMELLAHRITSNVRELEGALTRIIANMQLVGREITLESAQEELHDLLRLRERRVTIDEIQRRVAEHYNIRLAEMTSARRARAFARPRQVAMYLAKQLTSRSLPEIGRKFGGRDHTTVMHAVRRIQELKDTDPALAEDVELLRRMLEG